MKENKDRIAHLLQHDTRRPIGKLLELQEDDKGLRFVSKLSESTHGKDTLILYQEGILKEHSIGFNIVKGKYIDGEADGDGYYEIHEVKLWEGSTVTWGANPLTPVVGIKDMTDTTDRHNMQMKVAADEVEKLEKLLSKGSISDEGGRMIEYQLEVVKNILSLKHEEPSKDTHEDEPTEVNFDFVKFFKSL